MDGHRLDHVARLLATSTTRRRALGTLACSVFGGLGLTACHTPDHNPFPRPPCGPGTCGECRECRAGTCEPVVDGTACDECQECQGGSCVPVEDGTACGECHHCWWGSCRPCDDGALCFAAGCQEGMCVSPPVACVSDDPCQIGICEPPDLWECKFQPAPDETGCGECQECQGGSCLPMADDTPCDDGDACTTGDGCQAGTCVGTPVACPPPDECHEAGDCDPATGVCTYPAKPDGTFCPLEDRCYQVTTCQAGVCVGQLRLACQTPDPCLLGACNPTSGLCEYANAPLGTACPTDNPCAVGACDGAGTCVASPANEGGTCDGGVCVGGTCCAPTTCQALGVSCGNVPDGCGGTLACGTCAPGFICCDGQCLEGNCCGDADCPGQHCCSHGCLECCEDAHCPPAHSCDFGTCVPL